MSVASRLAIAPQVKKLHLRYVAFLQWRATRRCEISHRRLTGDKAPQKIVARALATIFWNFFGNLLENF
ncbi:MAG: hypothetical protein EAZ23_10320 [Oscillatoriales cyanobacterium]|nr:MAG: hypothetical protein EAZ23_10320 [Oscillatoriales cyanobacterium]